jgi:hypothetical protein
MGHTEHNATPQSFNAPIFKILLEPHKSARWSTAFGQAPLPLTNLETYSREEEFT